MFEARSCSYNFCSCQEVRPSLSEEENKRGSKKRELDELSQNYIQEKGFTVIEEGEREWWGLYKPTTDVKLHIRKKIPSKRLLREHQLQEGKKASVFGYVQYNH